MIKITYKQVTECVAALQNIKFSVSTPAKWVMWKSSTLKKLRDKFEDYEAAGKFDEDMEKVAEEYRAKLKEVQDEFAKKDENGNVKREPRTNEPVIDATKKAGFDEKMEVLKEEYKELFDVDKRIVEELKELEKETVKIQIDKYSFKDIENKEMIDQGDTDAVFLYLIKD